MTAIATPRKKQAPRAQSPLSRYATATDTGLLFDPAMPYPAWAKVGPAIGAEYLIGRPRWWLGDWVNFGETVYGEKYAQALEDTGMEYKSLANCARVSKRVAPATRRGLPLSWSHHEEVAVFEDAPTQTIWLRRAEAKGWNSKQLREAIREDRAGARAASPGAAKDPALGLTAAQVKAAVRRACVEWY